MNKPGHITRGNVFDDLSFSPEDVAAVKVKAQILSSLLSHIQEHGLTQAQLVKLLGDYQPNVSNLLNGKISKVSIEKLLLYAERLNLSAEITLTVKSGSNKIETKSPGRVSDWLTAP